MYDYKKISKLIDMPVISQKDKIIIGTITDIIFNRKNMKVAGYAVAVGRLIQLQRFLSIEKIIKISERKLFVKDSSALSSLAQIKKDNAYASYMRQIKGMEIARNGRRIGNVSDLLYRAEFGELVYFEVSDGFSEDLLKGRKHIVHNDTVFGNNNIEVRNNNDV
ncbi:MAG: PRC-barrel domain-containing protein [Firmicutes bacterium]|nr:PRC-barrel domain-containing protein [Bacillota bacterium]